MEQINRLASGGKPLQQLTALYCLHPLTHISATRNIIDLTAMSLTGLHDCCVCTHQARWFSSSRWRSSSRRGSRRSSQKQKSSSITGR